MSKVTILTPIPGHMICDNQFGDIPRGNCRNRDITAKTISCWVIPNQDLDGDSTGIARISLVLFAVEDTLSGHNSFLNHCGRFELFAGEKRLFGVTAL